MLQNKDARGEAVKALAALYAKEEHIGGMQHFTERFKGRLVEMAVGEPDVSVRVLSIGVLRLVDRHGLLEDDQRDQLACLIFHEDGRVRRAVAPFVTALLQDDFDGKRAELGASSAKARKGRASGNQPTSSDLEGGLKLKCLASLLSRQAALLDDNSRSDQGQDEGTEEPCSPPVQRMWRPTSGSLGRVAMVVWALWDEEDSLRDWQHIAEFLLSDHTKGDTLTSLESNVDPASRLTEAEESTLLEVLVASLQRAGSTDPAAEDGHEPSSAEITRSMMVTLPKLLAKYQGDPSRLADALLIVQSLEPKLYLELRKVTVRSS